MDCGTDPKEVVGATSNGMMVATLQTATKIAQGSGETDPEEVVVDEGEGDGGDAVEGEGGGGEEIHPRNGL